MGRVVDILGLVAVGGRAEVPRQQLVDGVEGGLDSASRSADRGLAPNARSATIPMSADANQTVAPGVAAAGTPGAPGTAAAVAPAKPAVKPGGPGFHIPKKKK